eukprot:189131_1
MSTENEADFDIIDEECRGISNKKHGNLAKLIGSRDTSKRMCNIGLLLSPFLMGIPLAWIECKRHHLIKQKLSATNMKWNDTYEKCIRKKQREYRLSQQHAEKSVK